MRTKVDALVDLGEKVTGKPIDVKGEEEMLYGEDITEVIDAITENYSGGGSTGGGNETIWLTTLPESTTPELLDNGIEELEKVYGEFNFFDESTGRNLPDIIMFDLVDLDGQRNVKAGNVTSYAVSYDGSYFYIHLLIDDKPYVITRDFSTEQWTIARERNENFIVLNTYDPAASNLAIEDYNDIAQLNDLQYKFINGATDLPEIMFDYRDEGNNRHILTFIYQIQNNNSLGFTIMGQAPTGDAIVIVSDKDTGDWSLTVSTPL